jgi:hypothetical protein
LQAIVSSQARAVPVQTPALHASPTVQNAPSSQCAPSSSVNDVVEVATRQTRHELDGSATPSGKHTPSTRHPEHVGPASLVAASVPASLVGGIAASCPASLGPPSTIGEPTSLVVVASG